ncbi:ribosome rescue protein RqcH [Haloarchaeobius sp. HME9146]|uniref:ribosome rescue protein RqcH n=1 Tax=Haloarchaeobius sp. HME9146 TaxID=2978732 RepID=UPI0021C111FF|nr:ribosome rescue protein RqcH [Haloarchaeobius sp. HME9146]MCT9097086.1 ribosome rescue protein RqcH [Haloarchaeobius sp. HME9146]
MEPKRELTSVDLAALVSELNAYKGAKLDKAYLYGDDMIRLKMRDFERGRVELLLEVGDTKRAHVAAPSHVPDAPGRPPNFAMMLRNRLSGADFEGVEQFEFDRILEFSFTREDKDTKIIVELFGHGNVAVCDENYEVVDCLDTVRLKSRTVAPGSLYEFPESRLNPLTVDYEPFVAKMNESDTDVVRTLATQLNWGGLWGEELCQRAGVEKAMDIEDAGEAEYQAIYDTVQRLASSLSSADLDPRIYYEEPEEDEGSRRVLDVTPVPLEERENLASDVYDTFNGACDDYFYELELEDEEESGGSKAGSNRPDFAEQIAKHERIIEQQEGAIEGFDEQAEAEREKAELLYGHYGLVDEVCSTIRAAREEEVPWDDIAAKFDQGADQGIPEAEAVVSVDGAERTVTLDLDGTQVTVDVFEGVEKNADRLYTEAKRIEEKKEGALAAIEDTREELADIKERRDQWDARDDDDEDGGDDEDTETDWLALQSVPIRTDEKWFERFRWFHTSDGFLVIGGRNADQNEELVKKYLDKGDKVFHTQAHGAPVTIMKATDPSEPSRDVDFPESSIEEAAQFAVTYSSVWKDGVFAADVYEVDGDQVTKTPESGEYLEKGSFAIRGDRTYHNDTAVGCAVGIQCEPLTRVIGGPPSAIEDRTEVNSRVEPGRYAQGDVAKRIYRQFREEFTDTSFVRKVASPDKIQHFLPPGGSRILEE